MVYFRGPEIMKRITMKVQCLFVKVIPKLIEKNFYQNETDQKIVSVLSYK